LYQKFDYVKYLASLDRDARTNASKSSVKWPLLALKFKQKCKKSNLANLSRVKFQEKPVEHPNGHNKARA
jgi:hypothetical protein